MSLVATASQTVGPYFHIGLSWADSAGIAGPDVAGQRVTVAGRVLDGDGRPVTDALIEVWQADAEGRYPEPGAAFRGFGRIPSGDDGRFRFTTVKPGRVPGPGGTLQAPHLLLSIGMRGLLKRVTTRMYFPDDSANAEDPILALVESGRRQTLIARVSESEPGMLIWSVIMQGENETVFFDL